MMTPEQAVATSILICFAGAVLTLLTARSKTLAGWLAFLATAATAALMFFAVFRVLTAGPSPHPAAFIALPGTEFVLRLYVDGLTAMFLMLASGVAVMAALYSIGYMRHEPKGVGRYYPYFLLFVAGIYGLLSTTDMMWWFFAFWQLMTLPSFVLVRFDYDKPENVRAANKYLVLMEVACAAVMCGTSLLAGTGGNLNLRYEFDSLSENLPYVLTAHPGTATLAFALFLVGFGIKAGMWPFGQFWLPDAHPAAPSPVSAMLSGVMIKTAIYGLLRCFVWLVPAEAQAHYPLATWGFVLAVLGTITLFTGTLQALTQEQSKRMLAFSSIGQIGYMLLGMGACMAMLAQPATVMFATIALLGTLFHVLNHGTFKGLLFLNAGSMLYATGTQDLNKMGGLMKFMPVTALTVLVASFSIAGVPLSNGFASKWAILVPAVQGSASARYLPICVAIAVLISAVTLALLMKFFGVSFLSRTSQLVSAQAEKGRLEVGWTMQVPQVVLALACVVVGLAPALAFRVLQRALSASRQGLASSLANSLPVMPKSLIGVEEVGSAALFIPLILAVVVGLMFLAAYAISKLGGAPRRVAAPWLCGYAREADCHRYAAHNFYNEIERYFRWLGGTQPAGPQKRRL
jgi:formate hydrogenlyase subunit 3/multisubunit Na+/H+ antiporter MnhD subunit